MATMDRNDLAGRFTSICNAVRAWALDHPNEYALIYGAANHLQALVAHPPNVLPLVAVREKR